MYKILFIYGTRPEAIKMAPLIIEFKKYPEIFDVEICLTGQHRQMLDQVNDFFGIIGNYDLNIMKQGQTLFDISANGIIGLKDVLSSAKPHLIFVQGDTTSAFIGALCGYYEKIQIAHLEAGLRSFSKYSPFPEEVNRKLIGHIADFHFAPTEKAKYNLHNEAINKNVYNVGNTVIDALLLGLDIINKKGDSDYYSYFEKVNFQKKIILVTGHRRENFGLPFENICDAIKYIAQKYSDVQFIYPVHLNPNVRQVVQRILSNVTNVQLIEPLDYPHLIWLMSKSYIVLTDSGGIQEEAPSLGKPVLVMRDVTERMEGVEAGTAKLVGTDKNRIIDAIEELINNKNIYNTMANATNPYGDGHTSTKIVEIIQGIANFQ
jgi:UDP-N-acetylglucosamine 2-epimerase (non-hydrolysing)